MCCRNPWVGQGWEHIIVIFWMKKTISISSRIRRCQLLKTYRGHGETVTASLFVFPLMTGLWVLSTITLKQPLANRVYCKDMEGPHKSLKNLNNQAWGKTKRKKRFRNLFLPISLSFLHLSSPLLNLNYGPSGPSGFISLLTLLMNYLLVASSVPASRPCIQTTTPTLLQMLESSSSQGVSD